MPDKADTNIAPEYQDSGYALPPYRELFALDNWLANTYEHEALRIGEPPEEFLDLHRAVAVFVQLAMEKEGKGYLEMLAAIHAGEFD